MCVFMYTLRIDKMNVSLISGNFTLLYMSKQKQRKLKLKLKIASMFYHQRNTKTTSFCASIRFSR